MKLIVYHSVFQRESTPFYTLKPDTALLRNNNAFFIPDFSHEIQYTTCLVVKINKMGKCISPKFAHRYYQEFGIAVNFTAIDVLKNSISKGLPHEAAYAFDNSSAISPVFINKSDLNPQFSFGLKVNDRWTQQATISELVKNQDELISEISKNITLKIGDYILFDSSEGQGLVKKEDRFQGFLDNNLLLNFNIQ